MIVSGARDGVLLEVAPISIHGTIFFDLVYRHEGEAAARRARVGVESVYADPRPGDAVRISYLMNVATQVERRP